jgi:hypothetical protein
MNRRALLAALVFFGAPVSLTAHASDLVPTTARLVKLGPISALTYYTVEADGFRVVTTVQVDSAAESRLEAAPVRFVVTLAPGQATTVSVPRDAGMDAIELRIARVGDRIEITRADGEDAAAN